MVKREAVFNAVANTCRGYDYKITEAVSSNSIYVTVSYNSAGMVMRFSDHKGKTNIRYFDYTHKGSDYSSLLGYIINSLSELRRKSFKKSWNSIAA